MKLRRTLRFIGKWAGVAALSVAVCELSVRVWDVTPTYSLHSLDADGKLIEPSYQVFSLDPQLLYRIKSSPIRHINTWGFRDAEFKEQKTKPRIVVLGDSFPMGVAVAEDQTFPKELEKILGGRVEVYNLGVQGYGPDQELLTYERFGKRLHPDLVIQSLYPTNDYDDLIKDNLFTFDDHGQLVEVHPTVVEQALPRLRLFIALHLIRTGDYLPKQIEQELGTLFFSDVGFAYVSSPERIERGIKLMHAVLGKIKSSVISSGANVAAVVIPSHREIQGAAKENPQFEYEHIATSQCNELGINALDVSPIFKSWNGAPLYTEGDRHLSEAGHRLVAERLAELPEVQALLHAQD